MNPKQIAEIGYWSYKIHEVGDKDGFLDYRKGGLKYRTDFFPDFDKQEGLGLDMGCGPISVFEWSDKKCIGIDPLWDEYNKLLRITPRQEHFNQDGEKLPFEDEKFDWIFCYNVIDHTPEPNNMVDEMYRLLKPNGTVYLQVNFDDELSAPHYKLWRDADLKYLKSKFKVKWSKKERSTEHPQELVFLELTK